ncbi:MAG TPA: NAD(+) synthase [Verrucomicrobiota bacterium]|nr:NAD(+) synthase [Verrucomicrobiota bacterium]HNU49351.1 NAD(+) synthase [Verrucomicrobiota bacterium]
MNWIRLAAVALNQTPLEWRRNLSHIRHALDGARSAGAAAVCLPELCLTGYGCEDAFLSAATCRRAWRALGEILPATRGLVVSVGLPVLHQNVLFNCAALAVDGRLAGLVAKRHLAGDGVHYEPRWFKPWPTGIRDDHTPPDDACGPGTFPIGDLYFDVGGVRIGFEICEDAWVASRPGATLAAHGIDVIFNPSASHFAFGKVAVRRRFVLEGSRAFGVSYVYANLLGNEAGRVIYDGGALIASEGRIVAQGRRFGFADQEVTVAQVDLDATRMGQARTASLQPRLAEQRPLRVPVPFAWPQTMPGPADATASPAIPTTAAWETGSRIKEEEFARAVALGLFDYLRKSRSHGFVVSLSGGADSSAVSCLVHLALRLALADLGADGVRAALAHIPQLPASADPRAWTAALLTTVYQATANSGPVTRAAARTVADALGARHHEVDVTPLVDGYRRMIESAIGRTLDWTHDDIALQNLQARVRSPGVWAFANLNQALLLCTSNRSEAAVGYATMDGDTSGGLSPLAGIDKAYLRQWLRWLETQGPDGAGPIPALAAVNAQTPTAELRPPEMAQTDEEDLMPYPLLDAVERAAIRDKLAPAEVCAHMRSRFPEFAPARIEVWVKRFFRLWSRNQWKRERYAPSFHLDDENLDPKTWCRWPILSGGFEEDLEVSL